MTTVDKTIYARMFDLGFGFASLARLRHALKTQKLIWIVNDTKEIYMFAGPETPVERLKKEGIWPE